MKLALWPRHRARANEVVPSMFDRFFDAPLFEHLPEAFQTGLTPAVNIAENEQNWTVTVEMPGLNEEDIDVQVLGNQLMISAERKFEEEKKDKEFHRVEHQYGSISRSITLPPGLRTDEIDAVYKKGILTLEIPKVEPTPSSKVKIKSID